MTQATLPVPELTDPAVEAAISPSTAVTAARPVVAGKGMTFALCLALFLTMLPVTMIVPALARLKETFHASSLWSHLFMSINMIAAVVAAPLGAALSDRLSRRKSIIMVALLVNGALLLMMGYLCESKPVFWVLMTARFFEGAVHIVALTTIMALACDWAPPGKRGRMMGWIGTSLMFGTAFGSMLGGRLGTISTALVFHVGAGVAVVAVLVAAVGLRDAPIRERERRFGDAFRILVARPQLWVPYAYAFIDRFCVGVIVSTLMLYLGVVLEMTPAMIGGLLALFLFPFALLCYPAGRLADRIGRAIPMCAGSIGFGIVYALYGVLPLAWLYPAMLLSGILSAIMFAPNLAMCSDLAPPEHRAAAFAGFNVAGSLGFMAGPLIGAACCLLLESSHGSAFAYRTTFVIAGVTEVLCAIISLPWLLSLRRRGDVT